MIEVVRLTKRFGDRVVLRALDLEVADGERIAIRGPSGSGKTTLLRLLAGLEEPDEGRILVGGELASEPGWQLPAHRRGLGFVFQRAALWPHMTVVQNVAFGLQAVPRGEAGVRIERLLHALHIASLRTCLPHQLSGGEARRVAIARSLAPQPRGLLLDEPLTHLDDALRDEVARVLLDHVAKTEATLIVVTHDGKEASQLASRHLELSEGALVAVQEDAR